MAGDNIIAATTIAPKVLLSAYLGTSEVAVYTVPAGNSVKIATATLCNNTSGTVNVFVSVVPAGGAVDASRRIIYSYSLLAFDTLSLAPYLAGLMLGPGDFIAAKATTASAVSCVITGTVHS